MHGDRVEDPWFWMRDHTDPELLANLDEERAYYDAATEHLGSLRGKISSSLRARSAVEEWGCPWSCRGWTYQRGYPAGAQYPRLVRWPYLPASAADGHGAADVQVVLDLDEVAHGAPYAQTGLEVVSDDGRLLAYSLDVTGEEVYELRFRDLLTGAALPDRVPRSYYGGAFTADGSAFYYTVHDEAYRPHQVWRHRLGAPAAADELVLVEDDQRFELDIHRTRSGAYVVISATSRTTRQEWVLDAADAYARPLPVRARVAGVEDAVEHQDGPGGGRWLLLSNELWPEFSLLSAPVAAADPVWEELVPGRDGSRLASCDAFSGHVVLGWRVDARPELEVWRGALLGADDGMVRRLRGEGAGTLLPAHNEDYDAAGLLVEESSLVQPPVFSLVPFGAGTATVVHRTAAPGHDPRAYLVEARTVVARDGVPIPITLARAAGTPLDGTAACLVWAYGAYESCDWPIFDPVLPEWLDRGVVYVQAHVRGGGEGGRAWWDQGRLAAKSTTFTDLVDVADALAADGVVAADRIATRGLSAGGLLQGAVFTMRPDRWRIVVAEVPFVDCVTSMLDASVPLTVNEWEEWGDPHREEDYRWMRAYTPYENLPEPPWPTLVVTGALHDPRVLVHEPAKWVARMRAEGPPGARVLFRAETGAGAHTGPAGRWAHLDYEAEVMALVLDAVQDTRSSRNVE